MLEMRGVGFSYGTRRVVRDVSIGVKSGEMLALLGSNGAGKSTLMRIASGSLAPQAGEVEICGRPISHYAAHELAKMRAFLEQDSSLAFDCKVLDAVLIGRYAYGKIFTNSGDIGLARDCLKEVGLCGFEERFFMSLSGGERRRVMMARTLAQLSGGESYENKLLILDEPSAGLDPAHAHGALVSARGLADKGAAVVAVLHDINLAAQYADKIAFLKDGALLGIHSAKDAMDAQLLEDAYGCKCKIISDGNSDCALFLKR